jgi:nucleotide-binding universal stress UspA family protein
MNTNFESTNSPVTKNPLASVLIATDFSDNSLQASIHGFRTASLWGSTPHVAHVCTRSNDSFSIEYRGERLLFTPEKARAWLANQVDGYLSKYRETYGKPEFGVAMSHILVGDPAESIVQLAKELAVSLIVIGTSRNTGAKRWLMGSTAERIVRMAERPVLVYRSRAPHPEETIEPTCPRCVQARRETGGRQIWCTQHLAEQERRHTYHYRDKNARMRENMPLLFPMQG